MMPLEVESHPLSDRNPQTILPHQPERKAIPKEEKQGPVTFLPSHA